MNKNIRDWFIVASLVVAVTFLHYRTDYLEMSSHILFRELYFLPIIIAGFRGGMVGGLTTSIAITFLYLPYILAMPDDITGYNFGNIAQVILFNVIGLVVGWLRDRERHHQTRRQEGENLATMGRAISCIAHDLKTPLIAIGGFVHQVRDKITDPKLIGKLDIAYAQVKRLETQVGDMLAFAKPLQLDRRAGRIQALLAETALIASEKALRNGVTIKVIENEEPPPFVFDGARLQEALLNLINNAVEASLDGSEVKISCRRQNNRLIIEIIDNGSGIPPGQRGEIFKPFITSKKEGTGLGLPISKKIIDAHDGEILVLTNRENGATFRVILPMPTGIRNDQDQGGDAGHLQ